MSDESSTAGSPEAQPPDATPPSDGPVSDPPASTSSTRADGPLNARAAGPRSTFAGRSWVTLGFTVIVIVLLIIFIAENSQRVTVHFLGAHGSISAALALLIAAVAGALIMLLVGSTRILQLRRELRRRPRRR